jgi:hypothetical protein
MQVIFHELASWGSRLPPEWILLFALPFAVALAGLLVHCRETGRSSRP